MSKKNTQLKKELAAFESNWTGKKDVEMFEGKKINFPEAIAEKQEQINNLEATEGVMVETARSFSFKLNVGNYQSADFFSSQKAQSEWNDAPEVSEALYQFCKNDVAKAVNAYKKVLDDVVNKRAKKVAVKQESREDAQIDLGMSAVEPEIQINEQ